MVLKERVCPGFEKKHILHPKHFFIRKEPTNSSFSSCNGPNGAVANGGHKWSRLGLQATADRWVRQQERGSRDELLTFLD